MKSKTLAALTMIIGIAFAQGLAGIAFAQGLAADTRCTGPCPNNADCICGPCDEALVKLNGKWTKNPKLGNEAKNSAVCRASKDRAPGGGIGTQSGSKSPAASAPAR